MPHVVPHNLFDCAQFVADPDLGVRSCEEDWATGTAADGAVRTAYDACEVSCGRGGAARSCSAPRTCADTDADGEADAFACPFDNLRTDAASVACSGSVCQPSECCTECAE